VIDREERRRKAELLSQASLEQILAADKDNWSLPYSCIIGVEMTRPGKWVSPGKILIKRSLDTSDKKEPVISRFSPPSLSHVTLRYLLRNPLDFEKGVDLVRSVLSDRLSFTS